MATTQIRFKVRGLFPFPIDMLRYDSCYPASETEAGFIEQTTGPGHHFDPVTVELLSDNRPRFWEPTADRWRSFGWKVVE